MAGAPSSPPGRAHGRAIRWDSTLSRVYVQVRYFLSRTVTHCGRCCAGVGVMLMVAWGHVDTTPGARCHVRSCAPRPHCQWPAGGVRRQRACEAEMCAFFSFVPFPHVRNHLRNPTHVRMIIHFVSLSTTCASTQRRTAGSAPTRAACSRSSGQPSRTAESMPPA